MLRTTVPEFRVCVVVGVDSAPFIFYKVARSQRRMPYNVASDMMDIGIGYQIKRLGLIFTLN